MENQVKTVNVDYETVATMFFVKGLSVQDVANHFQISWLDARKVLRNYGFTVKKDEKPPLETASYNIVYTNKDKVVVTAKKKELAPGLGV